MIFNHALTLTIRMTCDIKNHQKPIVFLCFCDFAIYENDVKKTTFSKVVNVFEGRLFERDLEAIFKQSRRSFSDDFWFKIWFQNDQKYTSDAVRFLNDF